MGSTTGDLRNNLSNLLRQIRRMKMELHTDFNGLVQGSPMAFLPIIHHALMNYSLPLAHWLADEGYEMFGKNDLRFIESLYKVLRDVFNYMPTLTREQFLATGFAERKMIMTTDILGLCQSRHQLLSQKSSRKRVTAKKRPVRVRQEVLTVHASCGLSDVCSEQLVTNTKVEEDVGAENNIMFASVSSSANQSAVPTMNGQRCLEARYSGTASLPLLSNQSPVMCSVVRHKDAVANSETESVTTLDPRNDAATPSDVPSMTIVPYSSPSPTSWCSLPSDDASPTHSSSHDMTPTLSSGVATPNPGSCDIQKEPSVDSPPLLTGKVEQLTELVEKMSAKILLLETRLQLMETNTHKHQREPTAPPHESIPPSPPYDDSYMHEQSSYNYSFKTIPDPSLQKAQRRTQLYRTNSPDTKQLIDSLQNRARQTKQLLAAATNDY